MKRQMTVERAASPATRAVRTPANAREAHLMPSVVERYGRKRTEDAPRGSDIDPTPARGRALPADAPVSVETLQMLIRHLVVDSAFARHMEVSPAKTLKKVPYLTER